MDRFTPEQARLIKGLSQEQMSKLMGIHENTYISKEKGSSRFYIDEAYRFCEIVGMPMSQIKFMNDKTNDK